MSTHRVVWRVCLVEDDAWIRTFLRDVLIDEGFVVQEAADGLTGLRMVHAQPPDVVLLDLAMPEVTGLDVLHELKRDERTRDIPVLVMSAYLGVLAPEDDGLVAGVLRKPVVVEELLQQVRQAIRP